MFYAVLGGMKGITYTQVASIVYSFFAFMVPAVYISFLVTGNVIPQLGFGSSGADGDIFESSTASQRTGFHEYTSGGKSMLDVFCITMALMVGTAGLPHVIVRFFTVKKVSDARKSAGWALLFIAILTPQHLRYCFSRTNLIETVSNQPYEEMPEWFDKWETTGLLGFKKKEDGYSIYSRYNNQ
ncbi:MAG: hypothetical protein CM15mP83_5210 [Flavobacteriaceae bacterium]|nr:MAG: hypothetical protein CM15mP83_5210 [Flavobacteriaceae bacterium]